MLVVGALKTNLRICFCLDDNLNFLDDDFKTESGFVNKQ